LTQIKPKIALFVACLTLGVMPAISQGADYVPAPTGKRAKAVKKCKKIKNTKKRKACIKKAKKLPV
jgi:hypothetical protein